MLIPPVAQTGTGDRPVDDTSARVHQASGPTAATTLWPLAPPQSNQIPNQQSQGIPPLASTPTPAHNQGVNRYGLYSLFPGAGGGSYVAATPATPGPLTPARAYHATTHKVSESVFSAAVGVGVGGYTWGAPTPPPGSPYSPVPVTQLELLAKNLASLAPSGQQALSLQGVGVNVGSLHHAQHTQHTQQTLNLTGLHHLHHGGLHQNTFSPQLSLMTGNAPTLTINSFSSPNSTGNVVPTTGVLLQEYQSPTDSSTGCSVSMNGTSCPTSSTTSTMIVQGGQADTQVVQATGKKREAFLSSQGQPVKLENKPTMLPCVCRNSSGKTKPVHSDAGCSRTLPVASSWNGQDATNSNNNNGSNNLVKRESLAKVPCQVAEVSTSLHATTTSVKIEPVPPKSENGIVVSNTGTSGVPVGIAVARQRLQHQETSTSMRNVSLSHHSSHHASYHHFQPDSLGTSAAMAVGGATLVHCGIPGGEDRPAHVAIPSGALASSLNAATFTSSLNSSLNSTLGSIGATASAGTAATAATAAATTAWPQTLWQYPATAAAAAAAAAAAMPMEPVGFPQMGVGLQGGLQLVRDPSTGHLLLIHAAAEQMQQAVVWPNYSSHNNGNIVPPPLLLPPPPPSLQFLGDIGGARLVLTENKRKQQNTLPIVKIETDCGTTPTTIITSTESTKALQTVTSMTGTLVPDTTPLVTTLHYYPHAPALVQISQSEPTPSRSQQRNLFLSKATSPVSCLTPPPEVTTIHAIEPPEVMVGVQDASNQTDAPEPELEQEPSGVEVCVKQEQSTSPCHQQNSGKLTTSTTMNMTNLANYEVMTASPEKVCNVVRITTTTTTMNPTVCNVIKKVDKAENTIINMADCPKYSITNECRTVTSIDRTIEHVVTKDMDREHKNRTDAGNENPEMFGRERVANKNIRTGPHIIEITEENCDSFHENLELFGQRRDHSSEWHRDKTRYYTLKFASNEHQEYTKTETEEHIETEPPRVKGVAFTKVSERENCGTSVNETEVPSQELLIETKATTESKCDSCTKNLDDRPQAPLPQLQIAAKSFDMPNIDCEKETIEPIVVKQEADETAYEFCSYRCDVTSTTEKTKCQESLKRHAIEKSHPGIENVVEKLKKNAAAALQDSAHEKIDNSKDKNVECLRSRKYSEATPRKLENGLKKLILKSCENTQFMDKQDISLESQVSSIEVINADLDSRNISKKSTTIHTSHSELQRHMLNDNNNDIKSSNNNIKDVVDEKFAVKRENLSDACQESDTKIMCDTEQQHRRLNITQDPYAMMANNQSGKSRKIVTSKQKPVADRVDISGLELLSNSIEQLEHLNPGAQNTSDISESEISSIEGKIITLNQENNNNSVDSPLGLLCALAEQRFMEEVGDRIPRKLNLESSEEISYAGRLLLNLGKINLLKKQEKSSDKRKLSQLDVEHYNDFKRVKIGDEFHTKTLEYKPSHHLEKYSKNINCGTSMHGNGLFKIKEKSHKNVDISEQNGTTIDNDAAIVLHKTTTGRKSPCKSENYEENEPYPLREELDHYQQNDEQTYDKESMFQSNSSDSEMETYSHRESADGQMKNDNATVFKRRFSVTEHTECHDYRNVQAKLDAKKFIAKKGHTDNDTDWPNMDAMELDMRVRLADIQRQYREKQKELSKLTPRKDEKRSPTRPQKKSHNSGSDSGLLSTPPMVESKSSRKSPPPSTDFVPQALSSSVLTMPRCNINLVKLGEPRSHIKLLDNIPSIPIPAPPLSSPITVLPSSKTSQDENERSPSSLNYDTSSPVPTVVNSSSASKKRKVDRPRKLMYTSGSVRHLTEMIVAKKPKSKSSLVGYLLSSKSRHLQAKYVNKAGYTPLPFKTAISSMKSSSKSYKSSKLKSKPAKQTPLHNKNVISSIIAEKAKLNHEIKLDKQNKMKPKLKAETKVKTWQDVESNSIMADTSSETTVQDSLKDIPVDITTSVHLEKELEKNKHEKSKKKKRKSSSSSPFRHKSSDRDKKESKRRKSLECKECKECVKVGRSEKMEIINKCKLTSAHLAIDQLRVLTAMGGLFYAGRLSAVQAPDVYAITLDGERGNRPHIHSREEILRDAIIEVCPTSTKELPPGTRLCAYWSQQYRCLYPGTSVEPSEPDPELDEKFVSVEFDDGDSGRIALDDIRLLQPDYPVVEYDPNPLLSLGKRRRQTSMSTEDKRCSNNSQLFTSSNTTNAMNLVTSTTNCYVSSPGTQLLEQSKSDNMNVKDLDDYRERKRMKKRRRDKLKRLQETQDGKKKHRKHKCCEEHRKHKHRKHRKHKHKHHGNHSDGSHISGDSSCGQKSEEDLPKEEMVQTAEEEIKKELSTQMEIIPKTIEPICEETEKTEKPKKADKKTKMRERQESVESRSKMAAFLPARQLWGWAGKGYRRPGAKGRAKKQFFRAIQRGNETIQIGDSAVFLSTGRPDRPYIGRIESMWETSSSNMIVKVKWFYHPEETVGCPENLKYPGALFESPHMDENDVQTISHKCEVLPLQEYTEKLGKEPHRYLTIYDNNDIYYLAGYYDPTTYLLTTQPGVV